MSLSLGWWVVASAIYSGPLLVCVLKRRWSSAIAMALGVVVAVLFMIASGPPHILIGALAFGAFGAFGAVETAHPRSWWARRFYNPAKLRKAQARHYGWPDGPGR